MKTNRFLTSALTVTLLSGVLSASAIAQPGGPNPDWKRHHHPPPQGHRLDDRHWHDQHYLRHGYEVNRLPDRHRRIHFGDRDYYFYGGNWYRPSGGRFLVVRPPTGIVIPTLPPVYTTLWIGGIPYYYANDVYYVWRPDRDAYIVTEPPADIDQQQTSVMADELFVYPKKGQSDQQQADDRYACHSWSVSQTHYDPSQPTDNRAPEELRDKRDAYQRAMRACLEGRGYSVR